MRSLIAVERLPNSMRCFVLTVLRPYNNATKKDKEQVEDTARRHAATALEVNNRLRGIPQHKLNDLHEKIIRGRYG